ncbi:MAG: amidohydrolase, partial [Cyclobacteriaceae bacterium]
MKRILLVTLLSLPMWVSAQMIGAPDRKSSEGEGPFDQLIIRGISLIDGTGGPPTGPVDIVVENNKITQIKSVGVPHVAIDPTKRPKLATKGKTKEIDGTGKYIMPGIIDLHVHTGGEEKAPEAEYTYKLWMAHGITTVR